MEDTEHPEPSTVNAVQPCAPSDRPTIRNFKGVTYDINDPKLRGLSKQAIKRLLRDELWESQKESRRLAMRQRSHEKRREKRQQLRQMQGERPPSKKQLVHRSEQTDVGVVVDCGFSELMTDKEMLSFVQQLSWAYGRNRRGPKSMKFSMTSVDDKLRQLLDAKFPSWVNWQGEKKASIHSKSYMDVFDKSSLVYLTADSDNVIDTLEEGKRYIVGGIVDKNRYKNLCLDKANHDGIQTGRLPIGDYLQLATRKVLTVNQVCDIMGKYLVCGDWKRAFLEIIPGRKLNTSKTADKA